jgi:hypothetical protein
MGQILYKRKGNPLRIPIRAKFWKDGKLVNSKSSTIKAKVVAICEATKFDKAFLQVLYEKIQGDEPIYNSCYCYSKKDFKSALRDFTEKDLLDYWENGI